MQPTKEQMMLLSASANGNEDSEIHALHPEHIAHIRNACASIINNTGFGVIKIVILDGEVRFIQDTVSIDARTLIGGLGI